MARAFDWQSKGEGFDSPNLHSLHKKRDETQCFVSLCLLELIILSGNYHLLGYFLAFKFHCIVVDTLWKVEFVK